MNIAFPAILLFLLLSPGFIVHRVCKPREVRAADLTPFSATILTATAWAVVVNAVVLVGATYLCRYQFHLGEILRVFIGGSSSNADLALTPIYRRLDDHPFEPLCFFVATNLIAFFIAIIYRWAVSEFRLDQPTHYFYRLFRSPAPWYYLFSGQDVADKDPDAVVVSAIVSLKDGSYIFTGLLVDYELTEKGELDRVILSNASRCKLADVRIANDAKSRLDSTKDFYPIEGDRFVLRASEFTTLNIKFLLLDDGT